MEEGSHVGTAQVPTEAQRRSGRQGKIRPFARLARCSVLRTKISRELALRQAGPVKALRLRLSCEYTEPARALDLPSFLLDFYFGSHSHRSVLHPMYGTRYDAHISELLLCIDCLRGPAKATKARARQTGRQHHKRMERQLRRAIFEGDLPTVQWILQQPRRVNVKAFNENDFTALHFATISGHVAIVQAILQVDGVNVNARTVTGCTPLHMAFCALVMRIVCRSFKPCWKQGRTQMQPPIMERLLCFLPLAIIVTLV